MPLFTNVQSKFPLIINSLGQFRLEDRIQMADDVGGGQNWLMPNREGRGCSYLEDTDGAETIIVKRTNTSLHQSDDQTPARFAGGTQFSLSGLDTGYSANMIHTTHTYVSSVNNISGIWILGSNNLGGAFIHYKQSGGNVRSTSGWTAYDTDSPWLSDSTAYFLRRSSDGSFYFLIHDQDAGPFVVMRKAVGDSNFTNITTTSMSSTSSEASAYQINDDGSVHMMAYGNSEAKSLDGGVTWSSMSVGVDGVNDISYSPKYGTWVMACTSSANPGLRWSRNNGTSWNDARFIGASVGDTTIGRFTHIERIDPSGHYLLGVRSTNPIRTYISEDGGRTWIFLQALRVPYYGTSPELPKTVLVNTGNRILLYMGVDPGGFPAWNQDNSMFASGLIGFNTSLVGY